MRQLTKFLEIGQTVFKILRFYRLYGAGRPLGRYCHFSFYQEGACPPLGFVWGPFGPLTFGDLKSLCQIWLRSTSCSFDNMKVLIFDAFGSQTIIHAPKVCFWGTWPLNGERYQRNPRKAYPYVSSCRSSHQAQKSIYRFYLDVSSQKGTGINKNN